MDKQIQIKTLPISEYDLLFDKIKSIPKDLASEQILALIKELLMHPLVILQEISKESRDIMSIYRVRVINEGEVIDITNPKAFSYPPKECSTLQRCNFKGEPVFYGSFSPQTALLESKKSIALNKSTVYLSKWVIKDCPDPLWCQRMFYGLPENEDYVSGIFSTSLKKETRRIFKNLSEEQLISIEYYLKRYQELFTSEGEDYYHITASIVSDLFKNYHGQELANAPYLINTPIFTYPSLAHNKESMNYAITAEFADNYLVLQQVDKIKVKSFDENGSTSTCTDRAIIKDGTIKWASCEMRLLNNPFSEVHLFIGDIKDNKFYNLDNAKDDNIQRIKNYFEKKNIDLKDYIVELTKNESFEHSNVVEGNTWIAIPVEDVYFASKDKTREKISAIGVFIHYTTGFHFND